MSRRQRDTLVLGGLVAVIVLPLLVAVIALGDPRWLAMSDVAHLEMRVRDVGTSHTPLLGLGGRLEGFGEQGSHPGPLPFYALALPYRTLGGEGWSLLAATALLNAVAAGLAIWLGYRRGGWPFALAVTGTLALLLRGYGTEVMVEAWTPHLALAWWMVFLLAIWSLLGGDLAGLPVVVWSGSYVVQAHVGYSALVGVLALVGVGALAWPAVRRARERVRDSEADSSDPYGRRRRWVVGGLALLVLLWLPPLVEQVVHDPGNLEVIMENFRHGDSQRVSLGDAWESWLGHLSVDRLLVQDLDPESDPSGPTAVGLALLGSWALSVVVAWRRRAQALLRLHVVVAVAFVVGFVSMTRIYGLLLPYLVLWAWGTTALMVLATLWTFLSAGSGEPGDRDEPEAALRVPGLRWRGSSPVLGLATGLLAVAFIADAVSPEMPDHRLVAALDAQAAATVDRLAEDPAGCGRDCRYLVTWRDPIYLASQGYGLMVELERRGFDTYATEQAEGAVPGHRVAAEADLVVHVVVTDEAIEATRELPGAVLVAEVDPYSPDERARYEERAEALVGDLERAGLDDLADRLREEGTTGVLLPLVDGVPSGLQRRIDELNDVTRPSAVFLLPDVPVR